MRTIGSSGLHSSAGQICQADGGYITSIFIGILYNERYTQLEVIEADTVNEALTQHKKRSNPETPAQNTATSEQ